MLRYGDVHVYYMYTITYRCDIVGVELEKEKCKFVVAIAGGSSRWVIAVRSNARKANERSNARHYRYRRRDKYQRRAFSGSRLLARLSSVSHRPAFAP